MKLTLKEEKKHELEVIIIYPRLDCNVNQLIDRVKGFNQSISVYGEGGSRRINISHIYYIDTVDRKVFIYTENELYRSNKKLYQLEAELKEYGFIKVNKACLLNRTKLKTLKNVYNSRLEAELINGDKINVSRTYLPSIKKSLI